MPEPTGTAGAAGAGSEQQSTGGATQDGASGASGTGAAPNPPAGSGAAGDGAAAGDPPKDGQQPPAKDGQQPEPPKSGAPETYELKLPDNSALDAPALERTAATARELGLSQEAAQKALEFVNSEVAAARAAMLEAYQPGGAEWVKQVDAWKAQSEADQALGKTPEERTATMQRGHRVVLKYAEQNPADAEAMKTFLNTSGLGNHPAAVRFFAWIGKAMSEGSLATPGAAAGGEKSAAQVLYGGTTGSPT